LPSPPVSADADVRDVPIPANDFIALAMAQFGLSQEEASKLVHKAIAQHHDAEGNALWRAGRTGKPPSRIRTETLLRREQDSFPFTAW
jgi:hypothetical protein